MSCGFWKTAMNLGIEKAELESLILALAELDFDGR